MIYSGNGDSENHSGNGYSIQDDETRIYAYSISLT